MIGIAVACVGFTVALIGFCRWRQIDLGRWRIPLRVAFYLSAGWMLYLALRPGPLH
jgi:hypothetical protein